MSISRKELKEHRPVLEEKVLKVLGDGRGYNAHELAEEFGKSPCRLTLLLRKLEEEDLVTKERMGRVMCYFKRGK